MPAFKKIFRQIFSRKQDFPGVVISHPPEEWIDSKARDFALIEELERRAGIREFLRRRGFVKREYRVKLLGLYPDLDWHGDFGKWKEQVEWFVDAGVDYIIGETFNDYGEALLALQAIQKYGKGLPAVITLAIYCYDKTTDDVPAVEACKRLEDAGAAVVGLNCARGPETMMPLIKEIRKVCKGPIAALPVMYRTTNDAKTFQALRDPTAGKYSYVEELSVHSCGRSDIKEFAEEAKQIGLQYVGLCCGNAAHCLRIVAETFGRTPPASRYKPDMSKSMLFRDNDREPSKIRKHMLGL